jgi:anti-sigma-K factor RskA
VDISCIISSGDIELYVMGLLPHDEARKMEQLIALFPEIREEADRISETLQGVADAGPAMPGAGVKDALMARLSRLDAESDEVKPALAPVNGDQRSAGFDEKPDAGRVVHLPRRRNYALAAAAVVTIISLAGLVYALSEVSRNRKEMAALTAQMKQARDEQQSSALAYTNLLNIAADTSYQQVNLKQVPGKPGSFARVFWNRNTKDVYLVDVSLPAAPVGKQYQLWAIVGDKPVDAGLVSGNKSVLQKMNSFDKVNVFAITLENQGGSPTPNLDQLFVLGSTAD